VARAEEERRKICRKNLLRNEKTHTFAAANIQKDTIKAFRQPQKYVGMLCLFVFFRKQFTPNKNIMSYMSQEGYDQLVAELRNLEAVERPKASAAIAEARDKGDLSENSEYEAAKEAQAHLEDKINRMKRTLAEAKVVDTSRLSCDAVQILSKVEMTNMTTKAKMTYTIVSENEADLRSGKISIQTPIAQGLLNKKVGDVAEITIPRGTIKLRIDKITVG